MNTRALTSSPFGAVVTAPGVQADTRTQTGLSVTAHLDRRQYPTGAEPTPEQLQSLRLKPHEVLPLSRQSTYRLVCGCGRRAGEDVVRPSPRDGRLGVRWIAVTQNLDRETDGHRGGRTGRGAVCGTHAWVGGGLPVEHPASGGSGGGRPGAGGEPASIHAVPVRVRRIHVRRPLSHDAAR